MTRLRHHDPRKPSPTGTAQPAGTPQRPVSPTEWLYLAARRLGPDMVLQLLVEGEGTPDADELRAAVATAARACPGSRLVRDGRTWRDTALPPRVRVLEPDSAMSQDGALDPDMGPSCEVVLLTGAPGRPTTLAFRVFHGVMDGHGALIWATEVFRALRGEPARPAPSTETDYSMLARLGATGRRPALLLDQPSPLAPEASGRQGAVRNLAVRGADGAAGGSRSALWRRRTLPGHHPALTARLAQALADAAAAPAAAPGARVAEARIMVPVDLRRHRPELSSTANLTLPVFLRLSAGEDWRAAQAQLLRALKEHRELAGGFESGLARLPLPAVAALLRAGRATAERRDRHLASAIVSHLGRIDLAACSAPGFSATSVYALPVHAPLVPVSCVAVETPTGTELTVGIQGSGTGLADRADALLDRLVAALEEPSAATPPAAAPPAAAPAPRTTVVRLFRDQVARTPGAPALDGPEGEISYVELDRSSDAVAAELLRRGMPPGGRRAEGGRLSPISPISPISPVGLIVDRSPAGIAGLWGILKSGAAYLPLDPHHPDARIRQVLSDAGVQICLTQRHLVDRIGAAAPCQVLAVEDIDPAPRVQLPEPDPDSVAYVIHTSGSTGTPKGVQIEHRSLVGFLRWAADLCRVDATTRFAFLSSYAFDISCFPLFLPLLAGGTAVLLPGEPTRAALHNLLHEDRVNTLAVTPSHLDLIERFDLAPGGALRNLLVGGEQFTRTAADRARSRFGPGCRIVNAYGPTEATVACLAHVLDGTERGHAVPIGHPGPYAQVELMAADKPIAVEEAGAVGEILVSGVQLARGYLDRPDLDAERFVTGRDGVRRYRTGDLGRRLPDGGVEFVGRMDDQVKIAGHRIEPAEIETALEAHPAVRRAAVTVRSRPGGAGPALCAYVLAAAPATEPGFTGPGGTGPGGTAPGGTAPGGTAPGGTAPGLGPVLRDHLAAQLPAYLVPAAVVPVADLPSTVSGKVDFAALPDPFAEPSPSTVEAPASEPQPAEDQVTEDQVAEIWSRVLQVDRRLLGPDSDFQQLGGDSLAVLEMLSAVASEVLPPGQESPLMNELEHLVSDLTLERVCAAVRRAGAQNGRRTEARA
ncbi:amino acid adenylation domain-containing protein [Streptomyces sp. 8N616]|uniref:amino acid adenylation domain-containing protein n=1 Tax=Streptomyces sp. 8N616 TaxID=3457414 RepID=UPI003FD56CCA